MSAHYLISGNVLTDQLIGFQYASSCSWALKQTLFPETVSSMVHCMHFIDAQALQYLGGARNDCNDTFQEKKAKAGILFQ